ncbi:MAG: DUF6941 family protein [Candidatus Limnocylindrales bacterium]
MRQELLILADAAEAINGKLYVFGGAADRHMAAQFPANLLAAIAGSVTVGWNETNASFLIKVRILDEDENEAWRLEVQAVTGRPPGAKPGQELRTTFAVRGPFPIPHPGGYELVLSLDAEDQEPPFRFWVDQIVLPAVPHAGTP